MLHFGLKHQEREQLANTGPVLLCFPKVVDLKDIQIFNTSHVWRNKFLVPPVDFRSGESTNRRQLDLEGIQLSLMTDHISHARVFLFVFKLEITMLRIAGIRKGLGHKTHTSLQLFVTCFTNVTKKGKEKYFLCSKTWKLSLPQLRQPFRKHF